MDRITRPARSRLTGLVLLTAATVALTGCTFGGDAGESSDELAEAIEEVTGLERFANSGFSILVQDVETGDTLYEHNASTPLVPGSTQKNFTTATALDVLGVDTRIETPVHAVGTVTDGVLDGDLVLVGGGDFSFGLRDQPDGTLAYTAFDHNEANAGLPATLVDGDPLAALRDLAEQIVDAGVREVRGDVIVDNRLFDSFDGWPDGSIDAIWVNENVLDVAITPGEVGAAPEVELRPSLKSIQFSNEATTVADGETKLEVTDAGGGRFVLTGQIAASGEPTRRTAEIEDPPAFARMAFREVLADAGVTVASDGGASAEERLPASYTGDPVATWESATTAERVKVVQKVSYNRGAQLFACLIAVESGSKDCADGLGVILDLLAELGVPEGSVFLFDPAGSIDYNRASALAHATVLRAAVDTEWGEAWHDALPIAGVDGSTSTLGKGTSSEGKIQAKTGTRGVDYPARDSIFFAGQAFAGYATTDDGRELVFTTIMNSVEVHSFEELVEIITELGGIPLAVQQHG
jgi:D-alanyl-D-alanine carboxypeptidase/D-alanyl-D-alanine-endopeptidase (penicillin-binding protein 4)